MKQRQRLIENPIPLHRNKDLRIREQMALIDVSDVLHSTSLKFDRDLSARETEIRQKTSVLDPFPLLLFHSRKQLGRDRLKKKKLSPSVALFLWMG